VIVVTTVVCSARGRTSGSEADANEVMMENMRAVEERYVEV
jgi:hypothetical protein